VKVSSGTDLLVYGDSSGMQVKVPAGQSMVRGHYYANDALVTLAITTANATNPRIDNVVLELDPSANTILLKVVAGTPAASPVAPTLTQTDSGIWQQLLATVSVAAAASTIAAGNVTDRRSFLGGLTATGVATLTNKTLASPVFTGASLEAAYTTATGFAGYTFYATTNGAVQYSTASATASGTVNIASTSGVSLNTLMAVGQSLTIVLAVTNGATAYYPSAWQIDGSAVTPKWSGGTAPTAGNATAIDVYTLNIIKTASATYTVLASQTKFA